MADAQLDNQHCGRLGVTFDTSDLPDGMFLTAREAWDLISNKATEADLFGHGTAVGNWFVRVNLARDYLSLKGEEKSAWDGWRSAVGRVHEFDNDDFESCEILVDGIRCTENGLATKTPPILTPFWLVDE